MGKYLLGMAILLLTIPTLTNASDWKTVHVNFASAQLEFKVMPNTWSTIRPCAKDDCLTKSWERMNGMDWQGFSEQLLKYKAQFRLNDWLYYRLMMAATEQILLQDKLNPVKEDFPMRQAVITAFLLEKEGYEIKLNNAGYQTLFVYAFSKDQLDNQGGWYSAEKKGYYYNLTGIYYQKESQTLAMGVNRFQPQPGPKHFYFRMDEWPLLPARVQQKSGSFSCLGRKYHFSFEVDTNKLTVANMLAPMRQEDYLTIPLSESLKNQLLDSLVSWSQGMTDNEKATLLVSMVRQGFDYEWDGTLYQAHHPQPAETVLLGKTDHEERVALVMQLAAQVIPNVPYLVLADGNENFTFAMALPTLEGVGFQWKNKKYTFCDPSDFRTKDYIGQMPAGLKTAKGTVVYESPEKVSLDVTPLD